MSFILFRDAMSTGKCSRNIAATVKQPTYSDSYFPFVAIFKTLMLLARLGLNIDDTMYKLIQYLIFVQTLRRIICSFSSMSFHFAYPHNDQYVVYFDKEYSSSKCTC